MPSFLDARTATFYPWPQGPLTVPPDRVMATPFFMSSGLAYYFEEKPEVIRLPAPVNPGLTVSVVLKDGGSVEVEDDRGELVLTEEFEPNKLVTYTYINRRVRWKQVKI